MAVIFGFWLDGMEIIRADDDHVTFLEASDGAGVDGTVGISAQDDRKFIEGMLVDDVRVGKNGQFGKRRGFDFIFGISQHG